MYFVKLYFTWYHISDGVRVNFPLHMIISHLLRVSWPRTSPKDPFNWHQDFGPGGVRTRAVQSHLSSWGQECVPLRHTGPCKSKVARKPCPSLPQAISMAETTFTTGMRLVFDCHSATMWSVLYDEWWVFGTAVFAHIWWCKGQLSTAYDNFTPVTCQLAQDKPEGSI